MTKHVVRVELHDAKLGEIRVSEGGRVDIQLRHVVVCVRGADDRSETWSYSACLRLLGTFRLELLGSIARGDYVTEGVLLDTVGKEIALAIDESNDAGSMELVLAGSGAVVKAAFSGHSLVDLEAIRFLEDWVEDT